MKRLALIVALVVAYLIHVVDGLADDMDRLSKGAHP